MSSFFRKLFPERREMTINSRGRVLTVSEDGKCKVLKCNGVIQSRITKNSIYASDYWDLFPPLAYAFEKPRVLMIGLGGGTIVKALLELFGKNIDLDVVESDREVVELSRNFFGPTGSAKIIVDDGSAFIKKKEEKYDLIILDAYDADRIPSVFLRKEFASSASKALKKQGLLAINCISNMALDGSLDSYVRVLSQFFDVYLPDSKFITANRILLCSKTLDMQQIAEKIISGIEKSGSGKFLLDSYKGVSKYS